MIHPEAMESKARLIQAMVRGCLYRTERPAAKPGCAGCLARCHAGRGARGLVTMADCSRCLTARPRS